MTVVLYDLPPSPPCRAVKMTAEHLGIPLELKLVDLMRGEHLTPEFLAINPEHSVPVIDDDGFILWESRAIMSYLVNKYAPDSPLYPEDAKNRAAVDRMLHYDVIHISHPFRDYMRPVIFENRPSPPESEESLHKSLARLEKILESTAYLAGDHLTIADYSILSSLVFLEEVLDFSFSSYPKVSDWLEKMKQETPKYQEINEIPLRGLKQFLQSRT